MGKPDFIIIGGPKCGTTALFNYLGKHPDIYKPERKEINYMGAGYIHRTWEWYQNWFVDDGRIQGEATPKYFYNLRSPQLIKTLVPKAKVILLLRNPVDRAYSNYVWFWYTYPRFEMLGNRRKWSFEQVLDYEDQTIERMWPKIQADMLSGNFKDLYFTRYVQMFRGYYAYFLKEWLRYFTLGEDLLVIKSEDLFSNENSVYNKVLNFIGAQPFQLTQEDMADKGMTKKYPPMKATTRKRLEEYFKQKNQELYNMIGRDFGW